MAEDDPKKSDSDKPGSDIRPVSIADEMKRSYLDYAMSVIVSRALPDVRDGLKPVHRRILFSMHENGHTSYARRYYGLDVPSIVAKATALAAK